MSRTREQIEQVAIEAHRRGLVWQDFWPTVAGDVTAVFPDYYDRGRFIHRLVGLLASGDVDGQEPIDAGYGRPFDFELEALEAR